MVATIDALVDQLAVMRGAAMKAGQVLSTVEFPGLDPDQAEYLQSRLASLRDNVPAVGWKQMREVLEDEWEETPEDVLAEIGPEPRGGRDRSARSTAGAPTTARSVAVKVQYPGIADAVESDMRNLQDAEPGPAPDDARARRLDRHGGDARADRRGVRLRARGGHPPPRRPLLARPSVRHGARGRRRRSAAGECW